MFPLLLLPLSILAIRAPYPLLTERTSSSILVQYEDFYSASGGANIAYEVDFKSLFNSQWDICIDDELDVNARNAVYFISVDVDAGAIITKGYFQLAFGHSSSLSTDAGQPTYSYLIPFDASPGQVSSALGNVQGISVNQVTRCQTGYNGIALPCPKQSQGAYQWLVFLNTPVALSTDLYVLKYDFGSTWTGVGSQVKIHRFQQGMTSTNQCIDGICSYNCKNLLQSMGYSFRTRVLTTEGWTDYSAASEYVSTLEARAPGRPPPPFMLTSSTTLVAMQIYTPPSIEGVTSVESQYRAIGAPAWMNGPSFIFAVNQPAIILLTSLAAGLSYEMRIRSINHYGHSGYSGSSPSFKLQSTTVLNTSIDSLIQLIGVTYNSANLSLSSDPKIFLGQATFEVQYQSVFDTFWSSGVSTSLTSSIPGVFVQQVSTRSDSPSSYCEGTFQLSMGPVDPTNLNYYVTLPIQFNASADVMAAAIGAIGLVAATVPPPSIAVTQSMGDFNGWSWSIEIQGLAQDTPLQLFRSSLLNSFGGPCFSEGNSVVTQVVKAGSATQISSTKYVNIGGLLPQTTYLFRLHLTTADLTQLFSDPINATTLAFVVPTPVVAPPVYSEIMIKVAGGSTVTAANGSLAARSTDFYYTSPIATGGTFGMKGGDGYCVVILHDVYKLETFGVKYYFYSGYPQRLAVPLSADLTNLITFKCWGGGGGGAAKGSSGGGGGFAQLTTRVQAGDVYNINVGGGGLPATGEAGGEGGYNGGGRGGQSFKGGGGGGGGGASTVSLNAILALVAAGGGGAGSTDYCCATGGAGGGNAGLPGAFPGADTPFPITSSMEPTPVVRRFQYTSSACPEGILGASCISEWDILPHSLPADQNNLQYGQAPHENFTAWSGGGGGATGSAGGSSGTTGSYMVSASTHEFVPYGPGTSVVYSLIDGLIFAAEAGSGLQGGNGADGHDAGGGGGAGYFGGGGGGSGIDGAGGGGGSSYFDPSMNAEADSLFAAGAMDTSATLVGMPLVLNKTDISACLSWYFDVTKSSSWGSILQYDIEYAEGPSSEDFLAFGVVPATAINSASNLISANFTAKGLSPFTTYRFRVVPVFQRGASRASPPVLVTTFTSPENYWEALFPRRYSRANTGYGYSDPVLSRPHVDFPSNFTSLASKADEMTDGPTSSVPLLPSGRRGHSLTMLGDGTVYMFGGRTVGEPCSLTYTDYTNRETLYSPPIYEVNPCETSFGDVNEVWRVDIRTYEWELLKVNTSLPSAREQHASTALQDSIFIFGGKYTNTSAIGSGDSEEVILGDLWRLSVPYNTTILVINNATEAIPDTARLFSPANTSLYGAPDDDLRSGQCVQSVVVRVTFTHPCASQIRISLMGPGPPSGSQDFHSPSSALEEVLFNRCTTGGRMQCAQGLQNITFTDTSLRSFLECCPQVYQGDYHPEGHISTFIGSDPFGNWSLIVEDMVQDDLTGTLLHWELELVVAPCVPTYSWTEVSSLNVVPAPRYQARMITINSSFFLFGGQGISGEELTDLWRFDLDTLQWTSLATSNQPSSMFDFAYGASIMLSPLGILEFGGYSPSERSVEHPTDLYSNKLLVVDLSTKARQLPKVSSPVQPQPRYLAAAVYIPSSAISWRHSFSTAAIYNQSLPSTRSNFVGQMIESVFVFGGDVGISGMTADGSGGGALSDSWMLRLATFSTDDSRTSRRLNRDRSCAWRLQSQSAADAFGVSGCYGSSNSTPCNLVALFISAWCLGAFQTI